MMAANGSILIFIPQSLGKIIARCRDEKLPSLLKIEAHFQRLAGKMACVNPPQRDAPSDKVSVQNTPSGDGLQSFKMRFSKPVFYWFLTSICDADLRTSTSALTF